MTWASCPHGVRTRGKKSKWWDVETEKTIHFPEGTWKSPKLFISHHQQASNSTQGKAPSGPSKVPGLPRQLRRSPTRKVRPFQRSQSQRSTARTARRRFSLWPDCTLSPLSKKRVDRSVTQSVHVQRAGKWRKEGEVDSRGSGGTLNAVYSAGELLKAPVPNEP